MYCFRLGALPKSVCPPLFNRYAGHANAFAMHVDNAVRTHAATAKHGSTDTSCTPLRQKDRDKRQGDPEGANQPESPEVVRLTGCYHNLLRM
jgi:predicted 2-oxoglutarate/Fe(II)-dependent dioxygenase YbiX